MPCTPRWLCDLPSCSHRSQQCGYQPEDALGRSPSELLHGERTDQHEACKFTQQLHQTRKASTTLINYRRDGQPFVHHIRSELLQDPNTGEAFFVTESTATRAPGGTPASDYACLVLYVAAVVYAIFQCAHGLGALAPEASASVPWLPRADLIYLPHFASLSGGLPLVG